MVETTKVVQDEARRCMMVADDVVLVYEIKNVFCFLLDELNEFLSSNLKMRKWE